MKKMNKKGFTLIELLAIIVILAIIAVITVPIILNIIENAREGARKNSVIGYGKAIELAYTQALYERELNGTAVSTTADTSKGEILVTVKGATGAGEDMALKVTYEGDKVSCNKPEIKEGKLSLTGCKVNDSDANTYQYKSGKACNNNDTTCTAAMGN